jgi:hypothetical protein
MLSADLRLANSMMNNRLEEASSLAARAQEAWLSRLGQRLAFRVAGLLVAAGARLVSYGLPPHRRVVEGASGSLPGG